MTPIVWTLGDIVRKVRQSKGLTQHELAKLATLDVTAVIRLERESDKSERATITRVADALKIPLSQLYAYGEQATLFSELTAVEQLHVLEYERRLVAKRVASLAPERESTADPRQITIESPVPARKRRK